MGNKTDQIQKIFQKARAPKRPTPQTANYKLVKNSVCRNSEVYPAPTWDVKTYMYIYIYIHFYIFISIYLLYTIYNLYIQSHSSQLAVAATL